MLRGVSKGGKRALAAGAAVAVAIVLTVVLWPSSHGHHKATCWAHPGVIGFDGPGAYVPVYSASGTRHGPGSVKGICGP
jgi:hypothetical protein